MTRYAPSAGSGLVIAVVVTVACGCGGGDSTAADHRRAVDHLEPVEPLDFVAVNRPETDGEQEPAKTAVRTVGERDRVPVVPDSNLRIEIGMRLDRAPLNFGAVDITVGDQRVQLKGDVESLKARDRAEIIARSVEGVRAVDNDLEIQDDPGRSTDVE